jgi:uncharacterized repeat protein (TIGR03803 family)
MNKQIWVGQAAVKTLRLIIAFILLALAARTFNANAQTETNLYPFPGYLNDGRYPYAGLVQGCDGNFYGTTYAGGPFNLGTIFRISPGGSETMLYWFAGSSYSDGEYPYAGLVQGSDGNFYGTTFAGGMYVNGTVFRISPSGSYTNLHSFGKSPNDGGYPYAGLVQGSDGNFYGTTSEGGTNNEGTVFRISPSGSETNLHSFVGYPSDGEYPYAGLVQGRDGNFYGTAYSGGTDNEGTVFRISPSGTYTTLYSFGIAPNDGESPEAWLVQGSDGNLYGTTYSGGTVLCHCGTVFRISPSGSETNLHSFGDSDGANPYAGLVQGSDGDFYGTTYSGGTNQCGCGTVFRISPDGSLTTLYTFSGAYNDGAAPYAGLVQGSDGNFYGTTYAGGTYQDGTVFKLTVALNPPPNQISGIHFSVTNIIFGIPSIAGETYQLQYRNSMTTGSWSNVPGVCVTNSIGSLLTLTNFGGAVGPQGFYRFDITP